MQPIDAHLKNAVWHPLYQNRLHGEIYQDSKGRWKDGETITTSTATDIGQGMFRTKSGTVYQVSFAEQPLTQLYSDIAACAWLGIEGAEPENVPSGLSLVEADGDGLIATIDKDGVTKRYRLVAQEIV